MRWNDPEGPDSWTAYFFLGLSCMTGVAIGWAGVNAQSYLTATSFMVLGNVNKFIVIGVGMFFMHESSTWQAIVGCFIAISGGALYGLARNRLNERIAFDRVQAERDAQKARYRPILQFRSGVSDGW